MNKRFKVGNLPSNRAFQSLRICASPSHPATALAHALMRPRSVSVGLVGSAMPISSYARLYIDVGPSCGFRPPTPIPTAGRDR
ncbi:MAG: hypothetical protein SGPRY_014670, partial [Prymnesium sp.]